MIYSYKFEKSFFLELRDNLNWPDLIEVITFFKDFILNRENLIYFDNRDLIYDEKLSRGKNSNEIKELQFLFRNKLRPINKLNDTKVDYIFCNNSSNKDNIRKIGIEEIIWSKSELQKEIVKNTPNKWLPSKFKSKIRKNSLTNYLKRVFKYSNKIYFIDNFLPDHIMGSNLKSFEKSFEFYKNLAIEVKNLEFYNGLMEIHLTKNRCDKAILEEKLKKFYKNFKSFKSNVYVKHRDEARKAYDDSMYERMIITWLDDINISIIHVERGLNIISEFNTIRSRKLESKDREWCDDKLHNWENNVTESPNFIHFNTASIK